jgi:hypothetical protein
MQHIRKTFNKRVGEEARKEARKVIRDEQELNKCRRSILMHNADKWVAGDTHTAGYSLAERVTLAIHRIAGGMVIVMECFAIGAWQDGRMPISVYLTFGSQQQKTAFFRIMANRIRYGDERAQLMRVMAFKDAFPKEYISEAKELANKGMSLKRDARWSDSGWSPWAWDVSQCWRPGSGWQTASPQPGGRDGAQRRRPNGGGGHCSRTNGDSSRRAATREGGRMADSDKPKKSEDCCQGQSGHPSESDQHREHIVGGSQAYPLPEGGGGYGQRGHSAIPWGS